MTHSERRQIRGSGEGQERGVAKGMRKFWRVTDVATILIVVVFSCGSSYVKTVKLYTLRAAYCMSIIPHKAAF